MKNLIIAILVLAAVFGFYKLLSTNPSNSGAPDDVAELIFFWGEGCPHCEKVKEYIKANKIDTKVKIAFKEVYYNQINQQLLNDSVKKCPEIDTKQGIGVPLAVVKSNNQCLYGDEPIIDWLSQK